jgi:hypothetical protein
MLKFLYVLIVSFVIIAANAIVLLTVEYASGGILKEQLGIWPWLTVGILDIYLILSLIFIPGRLIIWAEVYGVAILLIFAFLGYLAFI